MADPREDKGWWRDWIDWAPGVDSNADIDKARQAREQQRRVQSNVDPFLKGISSYAPGGANDLQASLLQAIRDSYRQRGQGVVQDAARRGLLHSGQVDAYSRDLFQQQQKAETGARGDAAQFLLRALMGGGQLAMGSAGAQNSIQQFYDQLSQDDQQFLANLMMKFIPGASQSAGGAAAGGQSSGGSQWGGGLSSALVGM